MFEIRKYYWHFEFTHDDKNIFFLKFQLLVLILWQCLFHRAQWLNWRINRGRILGLVKKNSDSWVHKKKSDRWWTRCLPQPQVQRFSTVGLPSNGKIRNAIRQREYNLEEITFFLSQIISYIAIWLNNSIVTSKNDFVTQLSGGKYKW